MGRGTSRLALRHVLAVLAVTVAISGGELIYEARSEWNRGMRELEDVLNMVEGSYVPSVATGVFFFDERQLRLLAEGITLFPYVDSVTVLERRADEEVTITSTGDDSERSPNLEIHEYPLTYEYDGARRTVGTLRVTTNTEHIHAKVAQRLRVSTAATLIMILGFTVVILWLVQRMVFRHLWTITRFFDGLDPEHPGQRELVLSRRAFLRRQPDELDEITDAVHSMLRRQERVLHERFALVQELFHRTGNTVQSVQAILNLQSARHVDNLQLQTTLRAANNRILAIALAHQKLYLGGDLSRISMRPYLGELSQEVFQSYSGAEKDIELETDIEDVSLLIDTAIPCGMVVCELLSNSLEHAFPEGNRISGTVELSLRQESESTYRLTARDDGVGVPSGFDVYRDGKTGIQVVRSIVESQLNGRVECDVESGMEWTIVFSDAMYRERVQNG